MLNKKVLHLAPEKCLKHKFMEKSSVYETADFFTEGYHYEGITHNMDISDMHIMSDESFNTVIALDVMEHVMDDRKALLEILES